MSTPTTPRDAQLMDPQERLFLQTCWEVIEDAGHWPQWEKPEEHDQVLIEFINGGDTGSRGPTA